MQEILVLEDDRELAEGIEMALISDDLSFTLCGTVMEAKKMQREKRFDLLILDINLPDGSGLELCREIRRGSKVPIMLLTARDMELDIVKGLECGADDYITKPFGSAELLARIRTAIRHTRTRLENDRLAQTGVFKAGKLAIDYDKHRVFLDGKDVHLTQNEYKLVSLLGMYAGKVLTYDFLIRELWGPGAKADNQILRVNMANIRRKIEENPASPAYIFTEVGVGYRMIEGD